MKRLVSKALVIAIAAVIVAGATAAFANVGGILNNVKNSGVANSKDRDGAGHPGRVRGIVKSVSDNKLVVTTKKGDVTIDIDGKVRIVEVRRTVTPVGVTEGQHVLLIGKKTGDTFKVRAVIIRADRPDGNEAATSATL